MASAIADYQARPEAYSLTDWASNPTPAFGASYLFVRYLVDRHGEAILQELLETELRGIDALDAALRRRGDSFAGLFQAWAIANVHSDAAASAGTPYRYERLRLDGTYGGVELPGFRIAPADGAIAPALRPWGTAYHRYTASQAQPWRLDLEAPHAGRALGAGIAMH